jgi:hypothetical protein
MKLSAPSKRSGVRSRKRPASLSGPCTLEYLLIQGAVLGARAVLRSARTVQQGAEAAAREAEERTAHRRSEAHERDLQRIEAAQREPHRATELEQGLAALQTVISAMSGTLAAEGLSIEVHAPQRPSDAEPAALNQYTRALEREMARVEASLSEASSRLAAAGASDGADAAVHLAQAESLDKLLAAYLDEHKARQSGELRERRLGEARALLASLDDGSPPSAAGSTRPEGGRPPSEGIARVLHELESAESEARGEALLLELKRLIAEEQARAVQSAAAEILERTLKDLGFAVEPIAHTLFMEGGVAHFTRAEWNGYAVRLRASPATASLNFNMVREAGATAADPAAVRNLDARTEEAWCAQIPRLTRTLEQRGIRLKVARMLGAGEAPVQEVKPGSLPHLLHESAAADAGRLMAASAPESEDR